MFYRFNSLTSEEQNAILDMQAREDEELYDKAKVELEVIKTINPKNLEKFRNYEKPPQSVRATFGAICILLKKKETWEDAQLVLNDDQFLKKLENLNIEAITQKRYERIRDYYTKNS